MTISPFTSLRPSVPSGRTFRSVGLAMVITLGMSTTARAQSASESTSKAIDSPAPKTEQATPVGPDPIIEQTPMVGQLQLHTDPGSPLAGPAVPATTGDKDNDENSELQQCLNDSILALQATIDRLEQQVSSAEQAARAAEDQSDKLRRDGEKQQNAAEEQIAALEGNLQAARKQAADCDKSSDQQSRQLQQAQAQIDAGKARVDELSAQLATAHKKAQELGTKLSAESKANTRLEAELAQAAKARSAALKQHDETLRALQERLQERLRAEQQARAEVTSQLTSKLTEKTDTWTAERARLMARIEAMVAAQQVAEAQQAKHTAKLQASHRSAIAALEQSLATCRQALDEAQQQLAVGRRQQAEQQTYVAQIKEQLATVRGYVGPNVGGTASLESAKKRAALAMDRLRAIPWTRQQTPELTTQRRAAQADLFSAQALVAQLAGARGTVTVRPGETLSTIAARHYGAGRQWRLIYQANTHVISNPNTLEADIVLVLP